MTKYQCNHCFEVININFPPHEANYYIIEKRDKGFQPWYCKECMRKIVKKYADEF